LLTFFLACCSPGTVVVSPTALTPSLAPSSPTAAPSPTPTRTPSLPQTAEAAADALAQALEASDFGRLEKLIGEARWTVGFEQGEALPSMSAMEAVAWLRQRGGSPLAVSVQPRPLVPRQPGSPPGDFYVTSAWQHIAGFDRRKGLLFLQRSPTAWEWSGVVFGPP
jgi:hypothetical protein